MSKYFRADLRHANWWFGIAVFALCGVLIAALMPFDSEPPWPGRWDKTLHALSFLVLIVVCCGPLKKKFWVPVLFILLLCGVLIELIQIPLPGRKEEWGDLLADFVGLSAGLIVLKFWLGDWCVWFEQRLGLQ